MSANYPTTLDDDSSLFLVVDSTTAIAAAHHNNLKDAIKALEAKLGIFNSSVPTSIDYRIGHPTGGHRHDGASGQGPRVVISDIDGGAEGFGQIVQMVMTGTAIVGSNVAPPVVLGRSMQLLSIQGGLRRGASGGTTAFNVKFGPTAVYGASLGYRPIFPAGATAYLSAATPNLITYASGAVITLDVDAVGANDPGRDLSVTFIFRDR